MIGEPSKRPLRLGLVGAALCLLSACKPVVDAHRETAHFDTGTVAADEAGEVVVLEVSVAVPGPDGKYKGFINGDGRGNYGDPAGSLVSLANGCSGGRPAWLRSALHYPTVVVFASARSLTARGFDVDASLNDMSVVRCVKKGYSGRFKAGRAKSGIFPWDIDRSTFASLYEQTH